MNSNERAPRSPPRTLNAFGAEGKGRGKGKENEGSCSVVATGTTKKKPKDYIGKLFPKLVADCSFSTEADVRDLSGGELAQSLSHANESENGTLEASPVNSRMSLHDAAVSSLDRTLGCAAPKLPSTPTVVDKPLFGRTLQNDNFATVKKQQTGKQFARSKVGAAMWVRCCQEMRILYLTPSPQQHAQNTASERKSGQSTSRASKRAENATGKRAPSQAAADTPTCTEDSDASASAKVEGARNSTGTSSGCSG